MSEKDVNLKALRLLEITRRLQSIAAELEIEINAPARKRKPSQKMIQKAEAYARIDDWASGIGRRNRERQDKLNK